MHLEWTRAKMTFKILHKLLKVVALQINRDFQKKGGGGGEFINPIKMHQGPSKMKRS